MSQTIQKPGKHAARRRVSNTPTTVDDGPMSHKQVLEALSGLLLGLFVAMLSSTVVSNALPRIVADLKGSESGYTWVVVATLLTMTASTPVWGKLADLFSKKLLVQTALVIFVIGSLAAGLAPNMGSLIAARAFQGLGVGGLTALVQVVIASIVSPRERGRYSGYIGAVFALATVSGPLIGGFVVDSAWSAGAAASSSASRSPSLALRGPAEDPARADDQARGAHRLPRRAPDRQRRLDPADLGVAGRPQLRLGLGDHGLDGRARRGAARRLPS